MHSAASKIQPQGAVSPGLGDMRAFAAILRGSFRAGQYGHALNFHNRLERISTGGAASGFIEIFPIILRCRRNFPTGRFHAGIALLNNAAVCAREPMKTPNPNMRFGVRTLHA